MIRWIKKNVKNEKIKTNIKILWGFAFYFSGIFFFIRMWNNLRGRRLTIVTYHRVTEEDISKIKCSLPFLFVSSETLDSHLRFYQKHYRLFNFEQLSLFLDRGSIPPNSLVITFDDGYSDNIFHALPLMRKYGCPWVLFLATGLVGSDRICWWDRLYCYMEQLRNFELQNSLPALENDIKDIYLEFRNDPSAFFAELNEESSEKIMAILEKLQNLIIHDEQTLFNKNRLMNWGEVKSMVHFTEFGAHSHLHLNLNKLKEWQASEEIHISKKIIEERTGKRVVAFSFPAGKHDKSLESKVRTEGYQFAVTTQRGINDLKNRYRLKRINIWENTNPRSKYSIGWFSYKLLGF